MGGGRRIYLSLHWEKARQELKAGIWRQEPKQRSWKNAVYWLTLISYYPPRGDTAHSDYGVGRGEGTDFNFLQY